MKIEEWLNSKIYKIKRKIRKKYLVWKYNHNWNTGKVVILKDGDRQLGLTTMIIRDCIVNNYKLFVKTDELKRSMAYEMYKLGQLGFAPPITEYEAYEKYLMSPYDVKRNKLRGTREKLIVDNSCSNLEELHYIQPYIVNGFIYIDIAA